MKAIVVGAGLSGLALCYYLLEKGLDVTLFDERGVGKGASGIASLLKPKRNTSIAMQEALKLMEKAQICVKKAEGFNSVDGSLYLDKLFELCLSKGLKFEKRKVAYLNDLDGFDKRFIATGAWTNQIKGLYLPLYNIKGQIAVVKSKESLPKIKKHYLINHGKQIVLGETFEKTFENALPDPAVVQEQLIDNCAFEIDEVVGIKASLRSYHKSLWPLHLQLNHNTYFLGAMGSNGLLYHALFAKQMISKIDTKQMLALQSGQV